MARVSTSDDAGPAAFGIKLSISTGKHSPECDPENIMVNSETTVNWIFIQGAYILRDVHGRDHSQLQKDFDLYLLRPGRDDIGLNASREIADYGIKKNDELQFRHKTMPIPVCVSLCLGDDRKIEVNSGFPLMDVVPTICEQFGIKNHSELSLALKRTDFSQHTMQLEWLDNTSSLNGQGVSHGDMLVLRKKFFILNDDINEAISGNEELSELLYQQIYQHFLTENYVGSGKMNDDHCAKVSALLHHIEQGEEKISDEEAVSKVIPSNRQKNSNFYAHVVTAYYQDSVGTLTKSEACVHLLKLFSEAQSTIVNYYPVKLSEDSEELVLVIDGDSVKVCHQDPDSFGQLRPMENKKWRLRDLRDTDCSSQKEELLRVNVMGSWHELLSNQRVQLAQHLMEAHFLVKKKILRKRQPNILENWSSLNTDVENDDKHLPNNEDYEWPQSDEDVRIPEFTPEESSPKPEPEPSVEKQSGEALEIEVGKTLSLAEDNSKRGGPSNKRPVNIVRVSTTPPNSTVEESEVFEWPHSDDRTRSRSPSLNESREKRSKSAGGTSTSSTVHIPKFLGQDYREVLETYKLFQIVVNKQDIRPVLLDIHKPVNEVIEGICEMFGIFSPSEYYLWIPTGIQTIIEKYGGRPKKRIGKFHKRLQHGKDFAPRLDGSKSLKDQYVFSIKPYILHLRKYQPEDETDALDESTLDCGDEWPATENQDVARYRRFYQGWTGVVQGAYPIEKKGAVKLAALMTQIYFGDKDKAGVWPPLDYDAKDFLPERFHGSFGISSEVERNHSHLSGKSTQECINDVIDGCDKLPTSRGVFFEVSVPVKSDIFAVIPRKRMQQQILGISQEGIKVVDRDTGKTLLSRGLPDIHKWSSTENSFQLNFKEKKDDFNAYTYQTKEILDTLKLYIQMVMKGRNVTEPSKHPNLLIEVPSSPAKVASPVTSTPSYKSPVNLEPSISRLSSSSPTTYDL